MSFYAAKRTVSFNCDREMLSDQYEPKYNKELTGKRGKELRVKMQLVLDSLYLKTFHTVINSTRSANFFIILLVEK